MTGGSEKCPLTPRPGILDIEAYKGGRTDAAPGISPVKLSANESALGPSPAAIAAFHQAAESLHRYPDGHSADLREALAEQYGLPFNQLMCGAGSDEILQLLCRAYAGPGDEVLYTEHGFLVYPIAAMSVGATPVKAAETDCRADIETLLAAVTPRTRILFLANPNNPTGTCLPGDELKRLHGGLREDILLVIDSAYAEFVSAPDYDAGVKLVSSARNVVMTRTFSKIYGLAALRIGWAYGPPEVIDVLDRIRGPFNLSTAAQWAGVAALGDVAHVEAARRHNDEWRPWLADQLKALTLEVIPSAANFLLIRFDGKDGKSAAAADDFLVARGLLLRQVASYGLPDCLRLTVGTEQENRAVIAALKEFMDQ